MSLLGEDGRGYELARRLESCGAWRAWLGESSYASFVPYLSSPSAWDSFFFFLNNSNSSNSNSNRSHLHLQLRARALLFDKASISLFLPSPPSSLSKLNPSYLQLHGDDVYYTLEDESRDGTQNQETSVPSNSVQSKTQTRASFSPFDRASIAGSRYAESEDENVSRTRHNELLETWYNQFAEKYRTSRHHRFPTGEREVNKRTAEGMSTYLRLNENHRKRRKVFKDDQYTGFASSNWENGSHIHVNSISDMNSTEDETVLPEIMFPWNCVPDSALPPINREENNHKVEFYGVLDNLPLVTSRSAAMIERFGIRPEDLRMGLERSKCRGMDASEGNRKSLSQEQASQMSQKVIARVLTNVGIDSATEVSMEVLSQFLSCHISKLGRILKVLTDSYRKQCSAIELLKMFLHTAGYSNLGTLVELIKDNTKVFSPQTQQHVRGNQSLHQNPIPPVQQMPRQMHMTLPQNLAFQQQQQQQWKLQRRQPSTPRGSGLTSENRPMVDVKIENTSDMPMDSMLGVINKQQLYRQQMAMATHHPQAGHQLKQLQIPQVQTQTSFSARTPPVKVEGFQELMGGDSTLKHDSEEYKLTSPSK